MEDVNYIIKPYIDSYINKSLFLDGNIREFNKFLVNIKDSNDINSLEFFKLLKIIMTSYKKSPQNMNNDDLDVLNIYLNVLDLLVTDKNIDCVCKEYTSKCKKSILVKVCRLSKLLEIRYSGYLVFEDNVDDEIVNQLNEIVNVLRIVRDKISRNINVGFIPSRIINNSKDISLKYNVIETKESNKTYLSILKNIIKIK